MLCGERCVPCKCCAFLVHFAAGSSEIEIILISFEPVELEINSQFLLAEGLLGMFAGITRVDGRLWMGVSLDCFRLIRAHAFASLQKNFYFIFSFVKKKFLKRLFLLMHILFSVIYRMYIC